MIPEEKEVFKKITADFSKLKKRKRFGIDSEEQLIMDITVLLGIYGFDKSKKIENQIEEMIYFGEHKKWAMQGQRIEFDKLKKGKLKIRKLKYFKKAKK